MVVEPGVGLTVLGSAPIVLKILGPTADYIGDGLQNWAERRSENVRQIFGRAERRLGEEGLNRPGEVAPQVLKQILEDGSYCDDELGQEYFGGILASSKSSMPRDDRGATLAALAGRLSRYQLRCHYLMYAHARRLLVGSDLNLGMDAERDAHGTIFMPWPAWEAGMALDGDEQERMADIVEHCIAGLVRENLIDGNGIGWGDEEMLSEFRPERAFPAPGGLVFVISLLGFELFTQAHGLSGTPKFAFLDPSLDFGVDLDVSIGEGAIKVADIPGPDWRPGWEGRG
jgi:hypothetical protein